MNMDEIKQQVDGIVGDDELALRKAMGDANYEEMRRAQKEAQQANVDWVKSRTAMRNAVAAAVGTVPLLAVAWTIWYWVHG